jgi:hypothetical protein
MNAKTYYEACWKLKSKSSLVAMPPPENPYEASRWKNCDPVANRAMFDEGMIFAGAGSDADTKLLGKVCPNSWSEVPLLGFYVLYIDDLEKRGGPSAIEAYLPAAFSIGRWAKARWPECSAEVKRQGYPPIEQKDNGKFGWSKACSKCK